MATWITHLRLAENLLTMIDGLDTHSFAIGNVAPDSGIPDDKWEKFDPPTEVTHFQVSGNELWSSADLAFYRRYAASFGPGDDRECFSFLLGYFFHLVTDNLWSHQIGRPTGLRFAAEFAVDPQFIWEVKRDWYGLDFLFVRQHPDSIFWRVFLDCQYTHNYLAFLPQKAIQQKLAYIKAFYQRTDEEIEKRYGERPGIYLSSKEMDDFVAETSQRLYEAYQCARDGKVNLSEASSVLEVFLAQGVLRPDEEAGSHN